MMQEIFEFSQLLPAVVDLTKVFKFCQELCQLGSFCSLYEDNTVRLIKNFLLECDVFLPSPNQRFLCWINKQFFPSMSCISTFFKYKYSCWINNTIYFGYNFTFKTAQYMDN